MKQLKETNPALYQIHSFILKAEELGFGSVEIVVKIHDYLAKIIDLKATKPKKKTMQKSFSKRVMVVPEKKEVDKKRAK